MIHRRTTVTVVIICRCFWRWENFLIFHMSLWIRSLCVYVRYIFWMRKCVDIHSFWAVSAHNKWDLFMFIPFIRISFIEGDFWFKMCVPPRFNIITWCGFYLSWLSTFSEMGWNGISKWQHNSNVKHTRIFTHTHNTCIYRVARLLILTHYYLA